MTLESQGGGHVPERRDRGEAQGQKNYEEIVEFWAGPMPDPETLREFNRAVPEMVLVFIIRMSYRPAAMPAAASVPASETEPPDPENSDPAD